MLYIHIWQDLYLSSEYKDSEDGLKGDPDIFIASMAFSVLELLVLTHRLFLVPGEKETSVVLWLNGSANYTILQRSQAFLARGVSLIAETCFQKPGVCVKFT